MGPMRFLIGLFVGFVCLAFAVSPLMAQEAATSSAPSTAAPRHLESPTPSASPESPGAVAAPSANGPAPIKGETKIDPAFLQEMENFYGRCSNNSVTATYYDCRCLAVKYLDKRIELGRYYEPQELMNEIRGECANPAEIAGYSYGVCTKQLALMDRSENAPAYCECFANAFAKSYLRRPQLSSRYIQILQRNAYAKCSEHRKD
jgi:hypothetical protein